MPEALDRCVQHVMEQGHSEQSAQAICRASMGLATDGTEDGKAPPAFDDAMRRAAEATSMLNQPLVIKEAVIAHAGRNFVQGDTPFDLTQEHLDEMVRNFAGQRRQVPVLFGGDHEMGTERADRPADGWVVGLRRAGADLVARIRAYGPAASAIIKDAFRGASIGARQMKDLHGKSIGWALDHLLITNAPFFADLNIAARRSGSGGEAVIYLTANRRKETRMPVPDDPNNLPGKDTIEDENALKLIEHRDSEIVKLKAENMNLAEQIETMKKQMEHVNTDQEKEDLKLRLARLERKTEAQEIRELVMKGRERGTLKAAWYKGFNEGGEEGTLSWFKASRFQGDLKLLKYQVEQSEPVIALNQRFSTGAPAEGAQDRTLSDEDKQWLRAHGIDPEKTQIAAKARDLGDYRRLKAQQKGA